MSGDTSTSQIQHCSNHLTLSARKNENIKSTAKISINPSGHLPAQS